MNVFSLFVVALLVAGAFGQQTLTGSILDFTPETCSDFEGSTTGDDRGIAAFMEDYAGLPIYDLSGALHPTVTSAQTFASWYRVTAGVNIPITTSLVLDNEMGVYSFDSDSYFPIDNIGFGNYLTTQHNYHFTTNFRTTWNYMGGETFTFSGNDDFFLFVNGIKVADLGGIHNPESVSISLDAVAVTANIVIGGTFTFNIYHAQRHTGFNASSYHISTNMMFTSVNPTTGSTNPGRSASICQVTYPNFCPGSPIPTDDTPDITPSKRQTVCPSDPTITFPDGTVSPMSDYNVVSFDSFTALSGDVQGRAAIRNNLMCSDYSFGAVLRTGGVSAADVSLPYALVVGGTASISSGAVYPDGTGIPYAGEEEGLFIGESFTGEQDLESRVDSCPTSGCLDASFDSAQAYYTLLQTDFAAESDNAVYMVQYEALVVSCNDAMETSYSLTVQEADFNSITWYNFTGCNSAAQFVLNVEGADAVTFSGNNQNGFPAEQFLYNILGVSRKIYVYTQVDGSILAPNNFLVQSGGVIIGMVIVADVSLALQINKLECGTPAPPVHPPVNQSNLCPGFETACAGLDFPLASGVYSFRDFNVISFGDFIANTGDVEGRLAVQYNVYLGYGFSIGAVLAAPEDSDLPYSLVAGGNVVWGSGALFPTGESSLPEEDMFVGGTFNQGSGDDLVARVVGGPCATAGCLDVYFAAAQTCYGSYQNSLAAVADNVNKNIQWDCLILNCSNNMENTYYVSLSSSDLSMFTYVSLSNCNFQASWVINIVGDDDIELTGDSFPSVPGAAVYNVIGSGRTINVTGTSLNGHLLAPYNTLYQPGGVIVGKVVAGNISMSLQINKQNVCPVPANVTVSVPVTGSPTPAQGGNGTNIPIASFASYSKGDQVSQAGTSNYAIIYSLNDENGQASITVDIDLPVGAGDKIEVVMSNLNGRPIQYVPQKSSASVLSFSVALVALIALVF